MTGLDDAFGEDFAQEYKQKIAERREEREKVTDESMMEIAKDAINNNRFHDGDPQFQYTTENGINHDVLLMQLPEIEGRSIFSYANELQTGAVTCPLDYLGEWMSCLFNNPEDLKEMEPGEHYIIIGQLDTWENDKGEVNDQVSPVRGVLTLNQAKEYANDGMDVSDTSDVTENTTEETVEEETTEDESEEDDSSEGGFLGDDGSDEDEDEPSIAYENVAEIVEELAGKDDAVWELEEGDDRVRKLAKVTAKRLDEDAEDDDVLSQITEHSFQRIEEEKEDEDEDDDDEELMF